MKTSFYFVLWIILCWFLPISGVKLIHLNTILIATTIVACAYRILNTRSFLPTLVWFEGTLRSRNRGYIKDSILDNKMRKGILRLFLAAYFFTPAIYIAYYMTWHVIRYHIEDQWWCYTVWEALAIYIIVVSWIIVPPKQNFNLDGTLGKEYFKEHETQIVSLTPRDFKLFQRANMFFSVLSIILGLLSLGCVIYIISSPIEVRYGWRYISYIGLASVGYLYGSLALYFGIKDFLSTLK